MKIFNTILFLFLLYSAPFFTVSEFYFVRHGQTDFNKGIKKVYWNMGMNQQGKQEIESLQNIVHKLPIEVIYFSPLKRAVQTKDILNEKLQIPEIELCEIKELRGKFSTKSKKFLHRVSKGLAKILDDSRISLVVGHGNVYKAICHILDVSTDLLKLNTAQLVHFYQKSDGHWTLDRM